MSVTYDLRPLAASVDVESMSSHLTEVMLDEVYSHVIDPETLRPQLSRSTNEKLRCLVDLMSGSITLDDIHAPAAEEFAAAVGHHGISEQTLERSYRVGVEALWNWWISIIEQHCERTGDPAVEVVRATTPIVFGFVDRMLFIALAAYHRAVAQRRQSADYRRARLVDQLLDGSLVDPGVDVERFIGYGFDRHHVAAVIDRGDRAEHRKFAVEFKGACDAVDLLVLDRGGAPAEVWLGLRTPMTAPARAALTARAASTGRRIAFGEVAQGRHGFCSSMKSARRAARIQAMLTDHAPEVLWAQDARIEMFALDSPDGARALVSTVLGAALERGLLTTRVRETLEAWLVTGSYVGAASLLGVHEQTARQRLHRLEEALGQSLHTRRTELHVALRLSMLTLPPDLPPG